MKGTIKLCILAGIASVCFIAAVADTEYDIDNTTQISVVQPRVGNTTDNARTEEEELEGGKHGNGTGGEHDGEGEEGEHEGVVLAEWNYDYVEGPLIITLFVLTAAIAKIGFHHAGVLSSIFPESCLLIVLGTLVGLVSLAVGNGNILVFTSRTFFLFLLPPSVLESAYSLHDRTFFSNFGSILLYAVVGTLLNCFLIGPSLYGISEAGLLGSSYSLTLVECLTFGALIVAVDPVAVLAIFQEVHVNQVLYFLVFGESLLNDAVTVVLYRMMVAFLGMPSVPASQIGMGVLAFIIVTLGSIVIGILCGIISALITKFTTHVRVVEPLAIIGVAYLSYLLAELFEFSGIIAIIACGLMQANYSFANISHKSNTTVKYFMKMLASTTESVIFFFLGHVLVSQEHIWNTWFVIFTLIFCFVFRYIVVICLTFLVNRYKYQRKINWEEQFIMGYGGLRGAVSFSLVILLNEDQLPLKRMFVTTTLAVIIFTVFVQGISVKPLVKVTRVHLADSHKPSMFEEMNTNATDYLMAGVEEIIGHKGENYIWIMLEHLDDKYFKKWLQKEPQTLDVQIMQRYEKISIQEHLASVEAVVHGMSGAVDELHRVESNLRKEVPADNYLGIHHASDTKAGKLIKEPDAAAMQNIMMKNPVIRMRQNKFDRNAIHDDHQDLHHYMQHRSKQLMKQISISKTIAKTRDSRTASPALGMSSRNNQPDDSVNVQLEELEDESEKPTETDPLIGANGEAGVNSSPPHKETDEGVNIPIEELHDDSERPTENDPLVMVTGEADVSETKF
ncbi:Na(+)/H(+) exchanger beta-like [Ptychodera flava]|uniref:Na(+)/H(+) exchanger beta-like n=1 Tax=Ptychodera flava TaxID=63121 RepID=UPI003969D0C1